MSPHSGYFPEQVVVGMREPRDADLQMRIVKFRRASFRFAARLPQKAGKIPPCVIGLDAEQIMLCVSVILVSAR